jgi:hypothetical protein
MKEENEKIFYLSSLRYTLHGLREPTASLYGNSTGGDTITTQYSKKYVCSTAVLGR